MVLHSITEQVLQQVHDVTGRPVLVSTDPKLKLIATSKMARGSYPAHLITYNPAISANADYVICFQCGFLIRSFSVPAEKRFDVTGSWRGRKDTELLLTEHLRDSKLSSLPKESKEHLSNQMFDGLILQLRSMPIGLRVDAWIDAQYPKLAEQQRPIIERQLNEAMKVLSPELRRFAPAKIFGANVGMSSAFASYWARSWADPTQLSAYKAFGNLSTGETLLKMLDEIPSDPTNDRQLIEAWGNHLGLSGWFDFLHFQ